MKLLILLGAFLVGGFLSFTLYNSTVENENTARWKHCLNQFSYGDEAALTKCQHFLERR
jgi:hypothetical protein